MGRRRVATKAPKTPLNRRRPEKETEELAVTPRQELAMMGLCKEDLFMCSQQADSQIDVRWDCNSPEALHQIKRYRGQFLQNDIADIVKKLGEESEEMKSEPLLGLWVTSKDEHAKSKPSSLSRTQRLERRRCARRPSGLSTAESADELIDKLALALHRHEEIDEEEMSTTPRNKPLRVLPSSPDLLPEIEEESGGNGGVTLLPVNRETKPSGNASRDLFESSEDPANERVSHLDKAVGSTTTTLHSVPEEVLDEGWSDDDLFANDSLLLKAESMDVMCSPAPQRSSRLTKRKSLLNSPSAPETKAKCLTGVSSVQSAAVIPIAKPNMTSSSMFSSQSFYTASIGNAGDLKGSQCPGTRRNGMSEVAKNVMPVARSTAITTGMANNVGNNRLVNGNQPMSKFKSNFQKNDNLTNNCGIQVYGQNKGGLSAHPEAQAWSGNPYNSDVIPSSQTVTHKAHVPSPAGRSSFKRHNTFPSVSYSPRNSRGIGRGANQPVPYKGPSAQTSCGVVLSKSNNYAFSRVHTNGTKPSNGRTDTTAGQSVNPPKSTAITGLPKPFTFVPSPVNRNRRRSSIDSSMFNTSLTDDLLCQLAEPDDLLDSQFDMGVKERTKPVGKNNASAASVKDQVNSDQSAMPVPANNTRSHQQPQIPPLKTERPNLFREAPKPSNHVLAKAGPSFSGSKNGGGMPKCPTGSLQTMSNCQPSQSGKQSQTGKYQFKSVNPKPTALKSITNIPSGVIGVTSRGSGNKATSPPVTSGPVKTSRQNEKVVQPDLEDSFLNDDDLSNPEVLAMLDEVEIQATQATEATQAVCTQGSKSPVFKCTPDEIEKKKRAAMERRKKNLQQPKKKPVPRTTSRHYKPLF